MLDNNNQKTKIVDIKIVYVLYRIIAVYVVHVIETNIKDSYVDKFHR